jgi:hypothetical protein
MMLPVSYWIEWYCVFIPITPRRISHRVTTFIAVTRSTRRFHRIASPLPRHRRAVGFARGHLKQEFCTFVWLLQQRQGDGQPTGSNDRDLPLIRPLRTIGPIHDYRRLSRSVALSDDEEKENDAL